MPTGLATSSAAPFSDRLRTTQSTAPPPNSREPAFSVLCLAVARFSDLPSKHHTNSAAAIIPHAVSTPRPAATPTPIRSFSRVHMHRLRTRSCGGNPRMPSRHFSSESAADGGCISFSGRRPSRAGGMMLKAKKNPVRPGSANNSPRPSAATARAPAGETGLSTV